MNGRELKDARLGAGWTQQRAAEKLGVTQAYLSMAERGHRVLPSSLARKAVEVLGAPPTALPLREEGVVAASDSDTLRAELAALGYPGFAHVRGAHEGGTPGRARNARVRRNPAEVLLNALTQADVDTRVVEGLPWLAYTYADLNWDWAVQNAKLHDLQNRLGFVTTVASGLGASGGHGASNSGSGLDEHKARSRKLKEYAAVLERSRLAKEDTLCHDSLTDAERKWLRANRPAEAAHWNLLTDMQAENLAHGRN
jgi:DNA-binding XRE family transcriptional regulator